MALKKAVTRRKKDEPIDPKERIKKLNRLILDTLQRISYKGVEPREVAQGESKIRGWQTEMDKRRKEASAARMS